MGRTWASESEHKKRGAGNAPLISPCAQTMYALLVSSLFQI